MSTQAKAIQAKAFQNPIFHRYVQHFPIEAGHQKRIGSLVLLHRSLAPDAAPALRFAPAPEVVRFAEPDSGLRLASTAVQISWLIGFSAHEL